MQLNMARRARIRIPEDFVREAMTPNVMGQLFSEVFVYWAYWDRVQKVFWYEATSIHFDEVAEWAEGTQLPVWEPEWVKLPGPNNTTKFAVMWRRVTNPTSKIVEREQSPTWKEEYGTDRNRVI